jgi:hypothetical protein
MGKRLLLSLALALSTWPALPQESSAPLQTAQAEEKPRPPAEQSVTLPETGSTKELLIGAAVLGLVLLGITPVESCDHSGDCGAPVPATTTTGTR